MKEWVCDGQLQHGTPSTASFIAYKSNWQNNSEHAYSNRLFAADELYWNKLNSLQFWTHAFQCERDRLQTTAQNTALQRIVWSPRVLTPVLVLRDTVVGFIFSVVNCSWGFLTPQHCNDIRLLSSFCLWLRSPSVSLTKTRTSSRQWYLFLASSFFTPGSILSGVLK